MEEQATFIPVKQGGERLQDGQGYSYLKIKKLVAKDRIYWACREKKALFCNSTAITQLSTSTILQPGEHNHGNRLLEDKVRAVEKEKVESAAAMPTVAPRTVLGKLFLKTFI